MSCLALSASHLPRYSLRGGGETSKVEVVSEQTLKTSQLHYRVLKKPFWLAEEDSGQPLLSPTEAVRFLQDHFSNNSHPVRPTGLRIRSV